jgi:hypothetical protein
MSAVYLHDSGRCTCEQHAGEYLAANIRYAPDARFHRTPLGTWERIGEREAKMLAAVGEYAPTCEECAR